MNRRYCLSLGLASQLARIAGKGDEAWGMTPLTEESFLP